MKVVLIYPPCVFPREENIIYSHCIGLRCIASVLKEEGHSVEFIDSLMLGFNNIKKYANGILAGLNIEEIVDLIPSDTDLIGVSAPFSLLAPVVHSIIDEIKNKYPAIPVLMGGIYPSTQPKLALSSKADYILMGEGELAFKEFVNSQMKSSIKGIYTSDYKGDVFVNADQIQNLDTMPLPDYSIPHMDEYFNISPRMTRGRTASIVTSRGCPFDCEFCSVHPVYGRKWRPKSAEKVLSEIDYLVKNHSIELLEIEDDNFTLKKDRTIEILQGIIKINQEGANLSWRTPNGVRIDTLDEEMIRIIKKSNCKNITIALEHGDQEMLTYMNKGLDLNKAYEVIQLLIKYEIPEIVVFIIVGYPGETEARFLNAMKYFQKIKSLGGNLSVIVNMAQPYPGTKFLTKCRLEGYIKEENFDNFLIRKDFTSSKDYVAVTTPDFDEKEVLKRKALIEEVFS